AAAARPPSRPPGDSRPRSAHPARADRAPESHSARSVPPSIALRRQPSVAPSSDPIENEIVTLHDKVAGVKCPQLWGRCPKGRGGGPFPSPHRGGRRLFAVSYGACLHDNLGGAHERTPLDLVEAAKLDKAGDRRGEG